MHQATQGAELCLLANRVVVSLVLVASKRAHRVGLAVDAADAIVAGVSDENQPIRRAAESRWKVELRLVAWAVLKAPRLAPARNSADITCNNCSLAGLRGLVLCSRHTGGWHGTDRR